MQSLRYNNVFRLAIIIVARAILDRHRKVGHDHPAATAAPSCEARSFFIPTRSFGIAHLARILTKLREDVKAQAIPHPIHGKSFRCQRANIKQFETTEQNSADQEASPKQTGTWFIRADSNRERDDYKRTRQLDSKGQKMLESFFVIDKETQSKSFVDILLSVLSI
jgi:hypothetical protein